MTVSWRRKTVTRYAVGNWTKPQTFCTPTPKKKKTYEVLILAIECNIMN